MTSLLNSKLYPTGQFKELYFKRWGVETFYDEFKNKLKVEHFSGYSNQSILQDFKATLFVSNVQTLIVSELEDELKENNRSEEHTSELQSRGHLVCRLLLEKKKKKDDICIYRRR